MPLWRVTCPLEERYVVAATLADAISASCKQWSEMKDPTLEGNGYAPTRVEQLTPNDPWEG